MRNILKDKNQTEKNPLTEITPTSPESKQRIICQIAEPLLIKCQNLLKSKHLAGDFTYSGMSDLIRKALESHKSGTPLTSIREINCSRKHIGFLLTDDLLKFYQELPTNHRVEIVERSLATYINNL